MKQPLVWIGVSIVLGSVSPLLRADGCSHAVYRRQCNATSSSDSWVMMAGCPEACATPVDRDGGTEPDAFMPSVTLDGNAWIMQLNLEQDGIEDTKHLPPSYDPGPGQDLVMALNRLNDGFYSGAARKSVHKSAGRAVAHAWPPTSERTDYLTALPDAPELPVAPVIASWASETYEGTIDQVHRFWRRAAHAVGMALIRSSLTSETVSQTAFQGVDVDETDPERQPPLDPLTAAWIESVRPEEVNESAVSNTPLSVPLPIAAAEPAETRDRVDSPSAPAFSVEGEIGCGAIGLPRPISAPEPTRSIAY